jgi:hypothetical protein
MLLKILHLAVNGGEVQTASETAIFIAHEVLTISSSEKQRTALSSFAFCISEWTRAAI